MSTRVFQWRSLKAGVTLLTLGILVLSIWALAFYTSRMLQGDMQQQLGEQQLSTATLAAQGVNEELKARINTLEKYAQGRIVPSMLGDAAALRTVIDKRRSFPLVSSASPMMSAKARRASERAASTSTKA